MPLKLQKLLIIFNSGSGLCSLCLIIDVVNFVCCVENSVVCIEAIPSHMFWAFFCILYM